MYSKLDKTNKDLNKNNLDKNKKKLTYRQKRIKVTDYNNSNFCCF